jgi:hypothetical protein
MNYYQLTKSIILFFLLFLKKYMLRCGMVYMENQDLDLEMLF